MRTNNSDISTFEKLQMALRFSTKCIKMKDYGYPSSISNWLDYAPFQIRLKIFEQKRRAQLM